VLAIIRKCFVDLFENKLLHMKKSILFIFCLYAISVAAQDFQKVDQTVSSYPRSFSKIEKLAELIKKDFTSDVDKARAIYTWIARNIQYDVNEYFAGSKTISFTYSSQEEKEMKEKQMEKNMAEQTLKKKKAVCQGYAGLYKLLCDYTGLECVVISGYSKVFDKDIGRIPTQSDHAWNAVKINNKWELLDVTWGAGNVDYGKKVFLPEFTDFYFMTPPDKFFLKHYPEDKKWLFVDKTIREFADLPLFYGTVALADLEIIKPKKGIISFKPKETIEFSWKTTLDPKDLLYAFKGDKFGKQVIAEQKDGIVSFAVPVEKSASTLLTIYYKGSSLLTYKLEKK
jgi:hypothetical protein